MQSPSLVSTEQQARFFVAKASDEYKYLVLAMRTEIAS